MRGEPGRIGFERQPAAHHLGPGHDLPRRDDVHGEPEPVEQLRTQFAFLRIHGSHQQERRGVRHRNAFPLDVRTSHRSRIQQQVHEVVVQQVHLVDVEHPPVRGGEQTGLEGANAFGQGAFQVQRADQPVLGGAHREFDELGGPLRRGATVRPVRALRVGGLRRASESAVVDHVQRRQQRCQRTHHRRLRGALFAADENPADARVHRVEQQRQPEVVVADDCGEGEAWGSGHAWCSFLGVRAPRWREQGAAVS